MTSIDIYRYFPTFLKLRDRLASNITDADSRETVLAKLTSMLDVLFDETDEFIQLLINLNDPDHTEQRYFSHVSYLLGMVLPNGVSEDETRFIIKHLVDHYKTSGTHPSWHRAWEWLDQPETKIVELFKHEQNEIANYAIARSVNHALQSARIQLGVCASTCESICVNSCESICESIVEVGDELPTRTALQRLAYIGYLRPIHVLLRQQAEAVNLRSTFPSSRDTLAHYPEVYNVEPDPWMGSEVYGTYRNIFWTSADELDVNVQCVALCEVSCQSCCEAVCECNPCEVTCQVGACELQCTENCQGNCEFACEGVCQGACAENCQAGACTVQCAGACLGACQGSCAGSAQVSCSDTYCEASNMVCQGYCTENSCTDSCTGTGDMVCGSSCQGYCTEDWCTDSCTGPGCTNSCTASCQGSNCQISTCTNSCTSAFNMACAYTCQTYCTQSWCTDSCTGPGCTNSCTAACQGNNCQAGSCQTSYCMSFAM